MINKLFADIDSHGYFKKNVQKDLEFDVSFWIIRLCDIHYVMFVVRLYFLNNNSA